MNPIKYGFKELYCLKIEVIIKKLVVEIDSSIALYCHNITKNGGEITEEYKYTYNTLLIHYIQIIKL